MSSGRLQSGPFSHVMTPYDTDNVCGVQESLAGGGGKSFFI